MASFLASILSYPTVVYTTLLGVVLVYWTFSVLGLVDYESFGPDIDIDADIDVDVDVDADVDADVDHGVNLDGEAHDIGTLASYLVALGLNGVPFSIVISLLVILPWIICSIASGLLLPFVPTTLLKIVVGTGILLGSFLLSLPIAAFLVRPLRKLFVTHSAISNASLVGQICVISTGSVDDRFGQADVTHQGMSYTIRVIAETPNKLKRGSKAVILEYDRTTSQYLVGEIE